MTMTSEKPDVSRRDATHSGASPGAIGALIDNVDVVVETYLGATTITIADLQALKAGALLTLDAQLNELVELRVNGVTVAHGELVAVGDQFGVRVTSVAP
jgi:flagellar motor switch protein FliN/FliY